MEGSARKVVVGLFLLVLLWIGVYWWWPAEPPITIAPVARTPTDDLQPPIARLAEVVPDVEPSPETPRSGVVEPQFRTHIVAKGETLESIATLYYGSTENAGAIARANPLMSPNRLVEGRTIRVPIDPENVQGKVVGDEPAPVVATGESEYVVQKGDSLARIAKRVYDDASLADMIYQANRDRLTSPQRIRAGQTLRIPPKPTKKP